MQNYHLRWATRGALSAGWLRKVGASGVESSRMRHEPRGSLRGKESGAAE